jgi:hypothetical protein
VNSEFVVEIASGDGEPGRQVQDLAEINRLFTAWVETVYHRRVHSETAAAPLPRWLDGGQYPVPAPADLAEAFAGRSIAPSPRRRWFPCTATVIRSTPAWSGAKSSWCSTRLI